MKVKNKMTYEDQCHAQSSEEQEEEDIWHTTGQNDSCDGYYNAKKKEKFRELLYDLEWRKKNRANIDTVRKQYGLENMLKIVILSTTVLHAIGIIMYIYR